MTQGRVPPSVLQVDRRWALIALLLVLVLGVSAVALVALPRPTPPGASPGAESAYARLFDQVGPNGEVTKEMALEAFSLAIAPLPGVTVPVGAPAQLYEEVDGTFALDWIRPYVDQLTSDQSAVVSQALMPDAQAPIISPHPVGGVPLVFAAGASNYQDDLHELLDVQDAIAQRVGPLALSWSLTLNTNQVGKDSTLAYAVDAQLGVNGVSGPYCWIHVNPRLVTMSAQFPWITNATLAHEMFHCFQYGHLAGKAHPADWVMEGEAEWVGEQIGGPTPKGAKEWNVYLQTPQRPLYARAYDAIGYYLHLTEESLNAWSLLYPMLDGGSNDAALTAGQGDDPTFDDTWASGLFRDSSLGTDWYAQGYSAAMIATAESLWPTPTVATRTDLPIANGDAKKVSSAKVSNTLINLIPLADVIIVRIDGHARLHAGTLDDVGLQLRFYCTHQDRCACPPGQTWVGPTTMEYMPANTASQLALTGGLKGITGGVAGASITDFCLPPSTQPGGPCRTSCGNSNGDPHLRTVNRYRYDFQGAGEFVLLRNSDSSIELQARQEPYVTSVNAFRGVSINTAIAARVNGHKVSVYATQGGLVLHVDGSPVEPAAGADLGQAAAVKAVAGGLEIDLPDGSIVWALGVGPWGINVVVQPSDALRAGSIGLLGPITPGGMGVPALPDGTQLPAAPDFATRHSILYGQFADAWRVTDATTLFDYDPGKSTATYTDHNFPSDADDAAVAAAMASPDPARQADAQTACSSISDGELQAECIFDVYATGDQGFAQQYSVQQDLYDSGITPQTPAPPTSGPATGVVKVVELQDLVGATIGPDDTLYVSLDTAAGANQLLAVDPTNASIKQQVQMRVATKLLFAADAVWAAGQTTDANGQHCSVTRYDPQTLATVGDYPIPCAGFEGAPRLLSMGDAVWFVDTSRTDPSSGAGTMLTRIDPATNAPGISVPLPQPDGCCQDSQGAIFCYCGNSDEWRLTGGDSGFVDLGSYAQVFPAGTGFWTQQGFSALFVDAPGGPSVTLPFTDSTIEDRVVGGDSTGVYVQGTGSDTPLSRVPADGGGPVRLASAPTYGSGISLTQLDYLSGAFPWFATPRGYLHLWMFKETSESPLALWLQWAPLR